MYFLIKHYLLVWFLALSMGCDSGTMPMEKTPIVNPTETINYLALGDSYTIGQSVDAEQRFPILLEEKLVAEGIEWGTTKIIAKTGWRTDQLQNAIVTEDLLESYELVSLLIGVNNQFQGRSIEDYETQFSELLEKAIALAGGRSERVFVLSIPDYAYTPYGQNTNNPQNISLEIDAFNALNKSISEAAGVDYFDITPISREGLEDPDLVASDNLHPSGEMYAAWVASFWESVKAKID